jgi:hypothetical protein
LAENKEIFAFVKNMSRDGGFYWVFAQVAPMRGKDKEIAGYTSVRRKPNPKAIPILTDVYRTMLEAERNAGPKDAMAASGAILANVLKDKGVTYDELIVILQSL